MNANSPKSSGLVKVEVLPAPPTSMPANLPPILAGHATGKMQQQVTGFYHSIPDIFERWVNRRTSPHTQRAYRGDVIAFMAFRGIRWPQDAIQLCTVTVGDVQDWRDEMEAENKAPKTLNRRVSSLSSFYKYVQGSAAEMRLPITVPNPAHAQFIARDSTDPVDETEVLSDTRARQLMGMPSGDTVLDSRDRAIIKFYLYSGARIATGCRLTVRDFHEDENQESKIRINEKGNKRRTIGLHFVAAQAIREYIDMAGLTGGARCFVVASILPARNSGTDRCIRRRCTDC